MLRCRNPVDATGVDERLGRMKERFESVDEAILVHALEVHKLQCGCKGEIGDRARSEKPWWPSGSFLDFQPKVSGWNPA